MIGDSVNARSGERVEFAMSRMGFCAVIKGGFKDHVYLDVIVSKICEEVIIAPT